MPIISNCTYKTSENSTIPKVSPPHAAHMVDKHIKNVLITSEMETLISSNIKILPGAAAATRNFSTY